jgi:hypothetical protein
MQINLETTTDIRISDVGDQPDIIIYIGSLQNVDEQGDDITVIGDGISLLNELYYLVERLKEDEDVGNLTHLSNILKSMRDMVKQERKELKENLNIALG